MHPGSNCLIKTHGGAGGGPNLCVPHMHEVLGSIFSTAKKKKRVEKCAKRVSISVTSVLLTQCMYLCWESRDIILREGEDVASVPLTLFKRYGF